MAEGKLRRYVRFHKDAVVSGGTKGVAFAGSVSLVLGGSVGAPTVWLAIPGTSDSTPVNSQVSREGAGPIGSFPRRGWHV